MYENMRGRANILLVFLSLIHIGCSTQPLRPIPQSDRISVRISQLNDLTGTRPSGDPLFEREVARVFLSDFYIVEKARFGGMDSYIIARNFLRFDSAASGTINRVVLSGDIERISYEPAVSISDAVGSYAAFGLIGLAISTSDADMGVYMQYRITVRDENQTTLDSILVIGVATGDPKTVSRATLTSRATSVAACNLLNELCRSLSARRPQDRSTEVRTRHEIGDAFPCAANPSHD